MSVGSDVFKKQLRSSNVVSAMSVVDGKTISACSRVKLLDSFVIPPVGFSHIVQEVFWFFFAKVIVVVNSHESSFQLIELGLLQQLRLFPVSVGQAHFPSNAVLPKVWHVLECGAIIKCTMPCLFTH